MDVLKHSRWGSPDDRLSTQALSETPPGLPSHRMISSRYTSDLPEDFTKIIASTSYSILQGVQLLLSTSIHYHYHPCTVMAPWLLGLVMAQAATGYHCAVNRNDTRRAKHAIRVCERRLAQRCRGQNRVLVPENNAGGSCLCMEQTWTNTENPK